MYINCKICSKEFKISLYYYKLGTKKFCSRECKNISMREIRTCKVCSKEFNVPKSSNHTTCSIECRHKFSVECNEIRKCVICNKEFQIWRSIQKNTCSKNCSSIYRSTIVSKKMMETKKEKYGEDWNNYKKSLDTKKKKYGTLNFTDKANQTKLELYGTLNFTEKANDTKMERYGTLNFWNKAEQTINDRYGSLSEVRTKHAFQLLQHKYKDDVIFLFSEQEYLGVRFEDIDIEYSFRCVKCHNEFKDSIRLHKPMCPKCYPKPRSKFQKEIKEYLLSLNENLQIYENNRKLIKPLELDLVLPEQKLAIECNGVFWHSELGGKDQKYHVFKTDACQLKNFRLIQIWETEWNDKKDIVKSILRSILKYNIQKIYARNCIIKHIDKNIADEFLTKNHLQGSDSSSIRLGLYYNEELVSIMTFGKSRFDKTIEWEMSRFCSLLNTNIVGGANKLFKYFLKMYDPISIISYSDRRLFIGTVYQLLGMKFEHFTSPNYYYFDINKSPKIILYNRIKFQKHKLKKLFPNTYDDAMTEWENMKENGYNRIWDCGHSRWIWKK